MINLSFIKLRGKVTDNYLKSLKGWRNKDVNWYDLEHVVGDSSIQFSPYKFRNGAKTVKNCNRENQDMIVLDIDDGVTIHEFQSMFKHLKYILATTKSHQKLKHGKILDRFRVIIPAINIPTDNDVYFRTLEILFPFSDEQVLTLTCAFLGTDNAIIIKNDGKKLDMFKASSLAEIQIEDERIEKKSKEIDPDLMQSYGNNDAETIKEQITYDIAREILESIGIEMDCNKFSIRDERTKSIKLYDNGSAYDFGDGKHYDMFSVLMEREGMSFPNAIRYCKNFI